MSFLAQFFGVVEDSTEAAVNCPFDHFTANGIPYRESNPSAHVNTLENLFHCKACGKGFSEMQFIQHLFSCSSMDARRVQKLFEKIEDLHEWDSSITLTAEAKQRALDLGIPEETIMELHLGSNPQEPTKICFPVFMYEHLVDIRTYDPSGNPKIKSRTGAMNGMVIPFDVWNITPVSKTTLICAGEKDMAIARSRGFNAITLTGGEKAACKTPELFRDRKVAIAYDNDTSGIEGAKKLALQLLTFTPHVKVVTGFHEVCQESGEDITDFFIKYGKSKQDLIQYLESTPIYVPTEEDKRGNYRLVNLLTASKPENSGRILQSNIQITAVSDNTFIVPSALLATKYKTTEAPDEQMHIGETREWELSDNNYPDILHLMDNNFTEDAINKNTRIMMKVPLKERCVSFKALAKATIYKASVTDLFETSNTDVIPMEYTAYSLNQKLESGKKYLITYQLVPHPYKGQQLIMIIIKAVQANDSISQFKITDETKQHLQSIQTIPGTVSEKIEILTAKVKGLLNYNGNNTLIQTIDLSFHTVLAYNFGRFENVRGYLDTMVVGESRMGKSSTAETLRKAYELGTFTSLAGNSATVAGLIGGSQKTASGGFQTRAGLLPQNHKGLVIFEEFGKCSGNISAELTDVRSSNEVRIARVSGVITLPAMVRMIALTNVKHVDGQIKPIAAYPNGISIITELVPTAEDIARYDLLVVLADRGTLEIDPFWEPEAPLSSEVYKTRIRWVWSRTPEQILISAEVGRYIIEQANLLNKEFDCHIKIFGTEAWKKISRLAIAVAGYIVSADTSFQNIVVTKDCVDFAIAFFRKIYDNPTFKLREYVENERLYGQIDEDGIAALQDIYNTYPNLIMQFEQSATANKTMLAAVSGLGEMDLNKALNRLVKGYFIRWSGNSIVPTQRFRLGLSQVNRGTHARRVGEQC